MNDIALGSLRGNALIQHHPGPDNGYVTPDTELLALALRTVTGESYTVGAHDLIEAPGGYEIRASFSQGHAGIPLLESLYVGLYLFDGQRRPQDRHHRLESSLRSGDIPAVRSVVVIPLDRSLLAVAHCIVDQLIEPNRGRVQQSTAEETTQQQQSTIAGTQFQRLITTYLPGVPIEQTRYEALASHSWHPIGSNTVQLSIEANFDPASTSLDHQAETLQLTLQNLPVDVAEALLQVLTRQLFPENAQPAGTPAHG